MVPSVPDTPGPAVGVPVVVSGGHAEAHAPVQALVVAPAVSCPKVYRVMPLASVSTSPSLVEWVNTVAVEAVAVDALDEVEGLAAGCVVGVETTFDPLLEQPATMNAPQASTTETRLDRFTNGDRTTRMARAPIGGTRRLCHMVRAGGHLGLSSRAAGADRTR